MHRALGLVLIAGMALPPLPAIADQNGERERSKLARLANEIDLLEQLIQSAERDADPADRFTFDYEGLRATLSGATLQIKLHLETQQRQPRNLIGGSNG